MTSNYPILYSPLLLQPSIFPSIRVFSNESVLHSRLPKYWSFSFSIQWIFRTDFLYDWLAGSPCSPRDSQESSPTPQFKGINSSVLSFLYSPTLTSIHDYWKNHQSHSQFSRSIVSKSLWPHEPQHTRPPCPLPIPGVYPNSCPLSQWCYPTISSSAVPFSSYPQSFSASGSFQMSQLFPSGGQRIGASASTSILSKNTQTDLL